MKKLLILPSLAVLVFIGIITFGATSFAAGTAAGTADSSSLLDLLKPVFDAFNGGHYAFAAALLVIALVALVKRYFGDKIAFLHSDAGGSLLALVMAGATASATALAAPGAHFTLALLKSSLLVGVGAAGGYSMLKALLVDPILVPYLSKRSWGAPVLLVINFIFSHGAAAAQAQATATAAGEAAVTAKPATGVAGATGAKPTELK